MSYRRCEKRDMLHNYRCQLKAGHEGTHWCTHGRDKGVVQWDDKSCAPAQPRSGGAEEKA